MIKVSVLMITYGHDKFIKQAIECVLMQTVNFDLELIIADDNPNYLTEKVVLEFIETHYRANVINYTRHDINKGINVNFNWAYEKSQAKYIALCEGDDYWTDPNKLQKQVDFLENNPDYSFCFHSAMIKDQITNKTYPEISAENRDYSAEELLLSKVAHTASFVFRNNLVNIQELNNKSIFGGDVVLALMLADKGKVFGMADYMCVYRMHDMGVTNIAASKDIAHQKKLMVQSIYIRNNIKSLSKSASSIKISDYAMTVALYYANNKDIKAISYFLKAVYYRPVLIWKAIVKPFK